MLDDAIVFATKAHAGQRDKAGRPYIFHPIRVASTFTDDLLQTIAVLHDVIEDTDVTYADLVKKFTAKVADAVLALTRRDNEPYSDFIRRAQPHPLGRLVKIADVRDNLRPGAEHLRERYMEALVILGETPPPHRSQRATHDPAIIPALHIRAGREGGTVTIDPDVQAVCAEFEIRIIPANVVPGIGETRAPVTLEKIKRKHGLDHMRFVVGLLAETENNRATLTEEVYWAVSDVVRAFEKNYPAIMENNVSMVYQFFDSIPLGVLQFRCLELEGITSKRRALVGMIWDRTIYTFGALAAQPDMLDDRRRVA